MAKNSTLWVRQCCLTFKLEKETNNECKIQRFIHRRDINVAINL